MTDSSAEFEQAERDAELLPYKIALERLTDIIFMYDPHNRVLKTEPLIAARYNQLVQQYGVDGGSFGKDYASESLIIDAVTKTERDPSEDAGPIAGFRTRQDDLDDELSDQDLGDDE